MGKSKIRDYGFTVLFMMAVTFVFIALVSGVHVLTLDAVAANEALFLRQAVWEAAGVDLGAEAGHEREALTVWYETCVRPESEAPQPEAYRITERGTGRHTGTVYIRSGAGLWGTITAAVGLDAAGKVVTGVSFLRQNETPGLGARIEEPWFKNQFKGKTGPFRMGPEGTRSAAPDEFDALTGATVTSTAVRDIVNGTLE